MEKAQSWDREGDDSGGHVLVAAEQNARREDPAFALQHGRSVSRASPSDVSNSVSRVTNSYASSKDSLPALPLFQQQPISYPACAQLGR
eukprot:3732326-Rhodomonas_salina.2